MQSKNNWLKKPVQTDVNIHTSTGLLLLAVRLSRVVGLQYSGGLKVSLTETSHSFIY